jgi:hypothetical protein
MHESRRIPSEFIIIGFISINPFMTKNLYEIKTEVILIHL